MQTDIAEVLYRPDPMSLGFLPEGPQALNGNRISWVGIQHGRDALTGSLNILDLASGDNRSFDLDGRPGFAIPLNGSDDFIVGLDRRLVQAKCDLESGDVQLHELVTGVDEHVSGTIINDGELRGDDLLFGCKELTFSNPIAGLYWFDRQTQTLHQLRKDQTCSNGKVILNNDQESLEFLDIDTPTRCIKRYQVDRANGSLREEAVVMDLSDQVGFPDGMVGTPDGRGVIVAFFNPDPADCGIAAWLDLGTGRVEHRWATPRSPQVTCPLLLHQEAGWKIVLTTAAENMSRRQLAENQNAGCLFVADTPF